MHFWSDEVFGIQLPTEYASSTRGDQQELEDSRGRPVKQQLFHLDQRLTEAVNSWQDIYDG